MPRYDATEAYLRLFHLEPHENEKRKSENTVWILLEENFILGYLTAENRLIGQINTLTELHRADADLIRTLRTLRDKPQENQEG